MIGECREGAGKRDKVGLASRSIRENLQSCFSSLGRQS